MNQSVNIRRRAEVDGFEYPTPEEIICLWQSLRSGGLSGDEAWNAVVAGLALESVFARRADFGKIEQ